MYAVDISTIPVQEFILFFLISGGMSTTAASEPETTTESGMLFIVHIPENTICIYTVHLLLLMYIKIYTP